MTKDFVFIVEDEFTQKEYVFRDSQNAKKFIYNRMKQEECQVTPFSSINPQDYDVIEKFYTEEEFSKLDFFEINEIVESYYSVYGYELMD